MAKADDGVQKFKKLFREKVATANLRGRLAETFRVHDQGWERSWGGSQAAQDRAYEQRQKALKELQTAQDNESKASVALYKALREHNSPTGAHDIILALQDGRR